MSEVRKTEPPKTEPPKTEPLIDSPHPDWSCGPLKLFWGNNIGSHPSTAEPLYACLEEKSLILFVCLVTKD